MEEKKIAFDEANARELCMVAVGYHNLAAVQLKLRAPDLACKSSQNARKIARLCLSYSNRYMKMFHWTHQLALEGVNFELRTNYGLPKEHIATMKELTEVMYDPTPT